jgi:hypothetical protein
MSGAARTTQLATLLIVAALTSACMAAAAGAGAAAAIAYNERNASADVAASVSDLATATEAVFGEMGITLQHRQPSEGGTEVDIHGRAADDTDVAVNIENEGGSTTRVTVTAREGELEWKPTYAGRILERIIERAT